jgi:hypothetical protein
MKMLSPEKLFDSPVPPSCTTSAPYSQRFPKVPDEPAPR